MAQLLATSPIVAASGGAAAKRVVLRLERDASGRPREFLIHTQRFYEDGSTAYDHGHYFPVFDKDPLTVQKKALNGYLVRFREMMEGATLANIETDPVRFQHVMDELTVPGKGG